MDARQRTDHGGALVTDAESAEAACLSFTRVVPEVVVCAQDLDDARSASGLLHRLRMQPSPRARNVPIIAVARAHDDTPMNEVLEAGFAGYIKAPLHPQQLCGLIAEVADAHPRDDVRGE